MNRAPVPGADGLVRILPPTDTQGIDYWERFSVHYNEAEILPCSGFVFDPTDVEVEGAVLSNVYAEYAFDLETGAADPDTLLPEFLCRELPCKETSKQSIQALKVYCLMAKR